MSRTNKNRNKVKMAKVKAKAGSQQHRADGTSINHFPHCQLAPIWASNHTSKNGWWKTGNNNKTRKESFA